MSHEIERALALVDELQTKRAQHVAKAEKLAAERDEIALGAFTGNDKHRKRVDEIHTTFAKHSSELAALDSALKSAHQRVADLRAAEVRAADRQRAEEAQAIAKRIGVRLARVDDHLAHAFGELKGAIAALDELHGAGVAHPSSNTFRVHAIICLKTVIGLLPRPWRLDLAERIEVAPGERQTFGAYWGQVQASVANQIAQRVGEAERADTEAA